MKNRVVVSKKRMMGCCCFCCWRELALFSLLLLVVLQMEAKSCYAAEKAKISSFKLDASSSSSSSSTVMNGHKGFKGNADSEEIFGADKRKVYTGPNPLHNR